MFFIPGWMISILTFPGVIVHEFAHRLFCDLARVPVYEVCHFRLGNPAGYVVHAQTNNIRAAFLISVGPWIINSLMCMILTFSATIPIFILDVQDVDLVTILLMWVGLSVGMHAIPSDEDIENFSEVAKQQTTMPLLYWLLAKPLAILGSLANILRVIWFDLIYAVAISFILPLIFTTLVR